MQPAYSLLWRLRRGGNETVCVGRFRAHEAQCVVLTNGSVLYTVRFSSVDLAADFVAEERQQFVALGWVDESSAAASAALLLSSF